MSLIKLKTKEEIKDFFKILAEESVKEAKKEVFSDDPMASRLSRLADADRDAYGLKEQGEGEAASVSITTPAATSASDISVDDESEIDVEIEDLPEEDLEPAPALDVDIEDVSLDAIEKKINALRGGRSLKDRTVEQGLGQYFDLLSNAERKALYAFLNALSSLMTGESSGAEADDPSDPPYNVTMTSGGDSEEAAEEDVTVTDDIGSDESESDISIAASDVEEDEPDESVPIRVGAVQESRSISNIRNKVQELLKKS